MNGPADSPAGTPLLATPRPAHVVATDISAQPAVSLESGFRLLVLRQFPRPPGGEAGPAPPAFAVIQQRLVRDPLRPNRHGMAFAIAFRPAVVAWLSAALGRPSQHDGDGRPYRNPRWPRAEWAQEARQWPDGTATIDWSVEATFPEPAAWRAFAAHWAGALAGAADPGLVP